MNNKPCISNECENTSKRNSEYCRSCLHQLKDIHVAIVPDPDITAQLFDYDAHCSLCSVSSFIELTQARAKLLSLKGIRCGRCNGSISIEALPLHARSA